MTLKHILRLLLLPFLIFMSIVAIFALDLGSYLSFEYLAENREWLTDAVAANTLLLAIAFIGIYALAVLFAELYELNKRGIKLTRRCGPNIREAIESGIERTAVGGGAVAQLFGLDHSLILLSGAESSVPVSTSSSRPVSNLDQQVAIGGQGAGHQRPARIVLGDREADRLQHGGRHIDDADRFAHPSVGWIQQRVRDDQRSVDRSFAQAVREVD